MPKEMWTNVLCVKSHWETGILIQALFLWEKEKLGMTVLLSAAGGKSIIFFSSVFKNCTQQIQKWTYSNVKIFPTVMYLTTTDLQSSLMLADALAVTRSFQVTQFSVQIVIKNLDGVVKISGPK